MILQSAIIGTTLVLFTHSTQPVDCPTRTCHKHSMSAGASVLDSLSKLLSNKTIIVMQAHIIEFLQMTKVT